MSATFHVRRRKAPAEPAEASVVFLNACDRVSNYYLIPKEKEGNASVQKCRVNKFCGYGAGRH